jgi:hypothetical protein
MVKGVLGFGQLDMILEALEKEYCFYAGGKWQRKRGSGGLP